MSHGTNDPSGAISDINVTPLVDVMLVLLIVLMVTASTAVAQALEINLPSASTGTDPQTPLTVEVDTTGNWTLNSTPIDELQLRARVGALVDAGTPPNVVIAADELAPHKHLVHVLDVLREERIEQVAIGVRKITPPPH
jgi:biopolymer transport protein ExbD